MPRKARNPGPINLQEISSGILHCLDNAHGYIESANLLIEGGVQHVALNCVLVAEQEMGKIALLTHMTESGPEDEEEWDRIGKAFTNHNLKAAHSSMASVPPRSVDAEDGRAAIASKFLLGPLDEELRRQTLYVDFSIKERR